MSVSPATFEAVVMEESDRKWELHRGRLREKRLMSFGHNESCRNLIWHLQHQLDRSNYEVRSSAGYLRDSDDTWCLPDVSVLPITFTARFTANPTEFESYTEPFPFVAEGWVPTTLSYNLDVKFRAYRLRGDEEIWRIHPFERTLTAWRRQPDGEYIETVHEGGIVRLHALPTVTINVEALFVPR
jgi:hypothetical protein